VAGSIFINYRRVESLKDAQYLKILLDKTFGANRVFLDVRGIDGGANWLQTIERQIAASGVMIVLIGKDWVNLKDEHGNRRLDNPNDKVRFEISQALLRDLSILPVMIDGAPGPAARRSSPVGTDSGDATAAGKLYAGCGGDRRTGPGRALEAAVGWRSGVGGCPRVGSCVCGRGRSRPTDAKQVETVIRSSAARIATTGRCGARAG
jgi:hypothetical protein